LLIILEFPYIFPLLSIFCLLEISTSCNSTTFSNWLWYRL